MPWLRALVAAMAALGFPLVPALAAANAAGAAVAAATAAPISVRDDRGTEHRLAAPAQRIVSMLPSLTEIVGHLQSRTGGESRLVGVDRHSDWPASVERLPRTGDMDAVAVETIVALRPDLVLASTSSRGLDRLESLGVRVVRLKSDQHADVARALDTVARLMGEPAAGALAWASIQQQMDEAASRLPKAWRGRTVYLEIGAGLGPFPRLNPEFVLQAAPDLVIGARREVDTMSQRPGWHALKALREGRRCALPPADYERIIRPGPRLGEAARTLADCIAALPPPR